MAKTKDLTRAELANLIAISANSTPTVAKKWQKIFYGIILKELQRRQRIHLHNFAIIEIEYDAGGDRMHYNPQTGENELRYFPPKWKPKITWSKFFLDAINGDFSNPLDFKSGGRPKAKRGSTRGNKSEGELLVDAILLAKEREVR